MFVTCKALLVLRAASVSSWSQLIVDSKSVVEEDSRATKQDTHAPSSMQHSTRIICRCTCRTEHICTCARACGVRRQLHAQHATHTSQNVVTLHGMQTSPCAPTLFLTMDRGLRDASGNKQEHAGAIRDKREQAGASGSKREQAGAIGN